MKIVYMGTPDFAVPALENLVKAGHEIVAVYTKEPKPAGPHLCMRYSPVYQLAEKLHLPIYTPKTFKNPEALQAFQQLDVDLGVVCAYGLILPQAVLGTFMLQSYHAGGVPHLFNAPLKPAIRKQASQLCKWMQE